MSTIRRGKTTQEGWEETRSVQNEQQAQSVARSLHDIIEGTYFSCRHTAKNLFVYPVLKALGIYEKHIGFVPMAPDATPELKVIGVGYGRTGTVSSFVHPSIHWFIGSLIRSFCRQRLAPPYHRRVRLRHGPARFSRRFNSVPCVSQTHDNGPVLVSGRIFRFCLRQGYRLTTMKRFLNVLERPLVNNCSLLRIAHEKTVRSRDYPCCIRQPNEPDSCVWRRSILVKGDVVVVVVIFLMDCNVSFFLSFFLTFTIVLSITVMLVLPTTITMIF